MKFSRVWLWLSVAVALLVALCSFLGIFDPKLYSRETSNWATQAVGQDIANLIAVSILLVSTYFLSKGSIRAYLVWLGTYMYLVYAFIIYAFFIHFNYLFLVYVGILGLSVYIPVGYLLNIDTPTFSKSFTLKSNVKPASILLMIIAVMFGSLWLSEIIPHLLSGKTPQSYLDTGLWTNPVHVLDLGLVFPGMVITSVLLWRRKLLGYFLTVPLLTFSAIMGTGIIALFILLTINEGLAIAPPAYAVGLIVILSTYFSYRFLENVKCS